MLFFSPSRRKILTILGAVSLSPLQEIFTILEKGRKSLHQVKLAENQKLKPNKLLHESSCYKIYKTKKYTSETKSVCIVLAPNTTQSFLKGDLLWRQMVGVLPPT